MALLTRCRVQRTPRWSSYWLKHVAEAWGRDNGGEPDVRQGELIIAALALGIPVSWDGASPNVAIAVSRADAKRLGPRWSA